MTPQLGATAVEGQGSIDSRLKQQTFLADLARHALTEMSLEGLIAEAARQLAQCCGSDQAVALALLRGLAADPPATMTETSSELDRLFLREVADILALARHRRAIKASRDAELITQQAQIELFYEHSSECHTVIAEQGDSFLYESANPAMLRLYGLSRDEVVGRRLEEVLPPEKAAEVKAHIAAALRGSVPYRYSRTQGHSLVEAVVSPVPQQDGEPRRVVVTARDITESRRLEEQLRQAQKMEAVGQLTGGIAHDFNNLLTVVIGNLDRLEAKLPDEALRKLASAALRGANRAATLTHRLLAFSRKQPLDPKPVDLNRLVSGMSELLRRSLGESIAIETVLAKGLWQTSTDPNQVENALLNLALNARDAMPESGTLTIETANTHLDEAYAETQDHVAPGAYVMLAVGDTGSGMAPEILGRVFEPFFTTKDVGYGSGLGLSMVYGFVKQSGGHLKIDSEFGHGTTVKLYLPRLTGSPVPSEAPAVVTTPRNGRGEMILVVEDDADLRDFTVGALRELGYEVLEAGDAGAALTILATGERIDLLFTDVGLPGGVNGRKLADLALAQRPGLRVLFTTGYARGALVHNGMLTPGTELIGKPFTLRDMALKIRDILDR